jgi:enamine deaminase RidA (YjgF/YER057c/UK114 family)
VIAIEERLAEPDLSLPNLPVPVANYTPAVRAGNLVFTSGKLGQRVRLL